MNKISIFIDEFIPKNISKKRRLLLTNELENHLLDKSNYYKEIGYPEEESIQKAIDDFGSDEKMKKSIFNEFEELYSEKSIFGVVAFFAIQLMNWICYFLGTWVISADFHDDPSIFGTLVSFGMILTICILVIFARIKKYRKMLIAIGLSNILSLAVILFNFYPQCASYSITYNLMYLIELFTPISLGFEFIYYDSSIIPAFLMEIIPFVFATYCFVMAVKIKKGSAKTVVNSKKKMLCFSLVFAFIALITAFLLPISLEYTDNYNRWFDEYHNCIIDESDAVFEVISIGDSYNKISNILTSQGYTTAEVYKKTLSRTELKQFKDSYKEFNFAEGYEVWFKTEEVPKGNGFIGIKAENGLITAKAIGNLEKEMYASRTFDGYCFGSEHAGNNNDIVEMNRYFVNLKKGESEEDVLKKISENIGIIYTKRFSSENGIETHYYRIVSEGYIDYEAIHTTTLYAELYFENGKLTDGTLYKENFTDNKSGVTRETLVK